MEGRARGGKAITSRRPLFTQGLVSLPHLPEEQQEPPTAPGEAWLLLSPLHEPADSLHEPPEQPDLEEAPPTAPMFALDRDLETKASFCSVVILFQPFRQPEQQKPIL